VKIIHLCLANYYIDNFSYQENELVRQNVDDGHQVLVVASTEIINSRGDLEYLQPCDYLGSDGARVIRIKYSSFFPHYVMTKLRIHTGLMRILDDEKPDVILFHSLCGWELVTVSRYLKNNKSVKFYVDSHEDFNNSARNIISRFILHRIYYRFVIKYSLKYFEKVLCISLETIWFVKKMYGISNEKIEFYPLGGFVFEDDEYVSFRNNARIKYQINDDEMLFVQSGKMDESKKLIQSLKAFKQIKSGSAKFIIAGKIHESIEKDAVKIIADDPRVVYVGWLNSNELRSLLCGADVYLQPGTQSSTMQMSLCCRCAVILDNTLSHQPYIKNNGALVNDGELYDALYEFINNPSVVKEMGIQSGLLASEILDYKKLAARLYV
jgi:1,2-diacylglycerol 3-alpha-glucosyltransferase